MLNVSPPLERQKTVFNPLRMNIERCLLEEGRNLCPFECWLSTGRPFRSQKSRKCCRLVTQSILMMLSLEYFFFWIRVLLHKICLFVPKYQIFVYTVTVFENEGVSDNTGESVFQFLVRYCYIKSGKIKRLDACYTVESWRFKMI